MTISEEKFFQTIDNPNTERLDNLFGEIENDYSKGDRYSEEGLNLIGVDEPEDLKKLYLKYPDEFFLSNGGLEDIIRKAYGRIQNIQDKENQRAYLQPLTYFLSEVITEDRKEKQEIFRIITLSATETALFFVAGLPDFIYLITGGIGAFYSLIAIQNIKNKKSKKEFLLAVKEKKGVIPKIYNKS